MTFFDKDMFKHTSAIGCAWHAEIDETTHQLHVEQQRSFYYQHAYCWYNPQHYIKNGSNQW